MRRAIFVLFLCLTAVHLRAADSREIMQLKASDLASYHPKLAALLKENPNQTGEVYRQGVAGGVGGSTPLPESSDRNHYLSIIHRGGKSWAESHDQKTDFYIILDGAGTLILGG